MFDYGHGIAGFVLTLISFIHGLFAFVTSLVVVIILTYHQYHNRLKREEKLILFLSISIYAMILIYSSTLISINILTTLGDIYGTDFNSSWCIFRGYFICAISCSMYQSFVIQVNIEK